MKDLDEGVVMWREGRALANPMLSSDVVAYSHASACIARTVLGENERVAREIIGLHPDVAALYESFKAAINKARGKGASEGVLIAAWVLLRAILVDERARTNVLEILGELGELAHEVLEEAEKFVEGVRFVDEEVSKLLEEELKKVGSVIKSG